MAKQINHQFVPGLGYVAHSGPPELPPGSNGTASCLPKSDAADGSLHLMQPPHGHPPIAMRWVALEKAWASIQPERGNRLAWPADFLSKAGWAYLRPALSDADRAKLPGVPALRPNPGPQILKA